MDKDTKDILEAVNFIKDHMVTKTDFDDAVEKLDNRLTAVESKIGAFTIALTTKPSNAETWRTASAPPFPTFSSACR
jgi:hypothetical protein